MDAIPGPGMGEDFLRWRTSKLKRNDRRSSS
jgi:hypothetical protein